MSIVIPCFNAELYVGEAIESALVQDYAEMEVIVIDDGSKDDSLKVIQSFGGRIRWEKTNNRGACAARNLGVELANGELIQFLDADDLVHPQKLRLMVPIVAMEGVGTLVTCDWDCTKNDNTETVRSSAYVNGEDSVVRCASSVLPTPAPIHWKSVLQRIGGFDETLPCSQERDLHLRIACHGIRILPISEVLVRVRRRSGSLSSDLIGVMRQHLGIVQRAYSLLEQLDGVTNVRSAALAGLLARDARVFLRYGFHEEASLYFSQARKLHDLGGWDSAYTFPHRWAARVLGARRFEEIVKLKRSISSKFG